MSWETYIVGFFEMRNEEDKEKVIEILKEELELGDCDFGYINETFGYKFNSLNFNSHITEESINKAYERIIPYVSSFSASLYYLLEPDYEICNEYEDIIEDQKELEEQTIS